MYNCIWCNKRSKKETCKKCEKIIDEALALGEDNDDDDMECNYDD